MIWVMVETHQLGWNLFCLSTMDLSASLCWLHRLKAIFYLYYCIRYQYMPFGSVTSTLVSLAEIL